MRRPVPWSLAGLLAATLLASGCAASAMASPAAQQQPDPSGIVAANPAVQAWFKRHESQRIAVDDALGQVNQQLAGSPGPALTPACAQLQRAATAMLGALPTPKRALDPQVVAGMTQFQTGAHQCLTGDLARARQSIAAGVNARAAAEGEIEEIGESPDGSVN